MLPNSLRLRGIRFAFLFGPPRFIQRDEASKVHGAVCDALGQDDLAFRYTHSGDPDKPSARGVSITFDRKEGRGEFSATIDMKTVTVPIRLLLVYEWPPSHTHATETFDAAYEAIFSSLPGAWTRVLAEVRLRAQCDTREKSALTFISQRLLKLDDAWLSGLGSPLVSSALKFEVEATSPTAENQLAGPRRELQMEVLREEPQCLYLELMSQWAQLPPFPLPPRLDFNPGSVRRIEQKPSEYVEEAYGYLRVRVESLGNYEDQA